MIIFSDKAKKIVGFFSKVVIALFFTFIIFSAGVMWEVMRSEPNPKVLPPYVTTEQIVEEVKKGIGCDLPIDEKNTLILTRTKNGLIISVRRTK